jgi:ribonucleoside-diphosphate reductase alpha chain
MEILVDGSSYPTAPIAQNSHDYRPLGLGYANLGSLLMHYGLPYDSDGGRALAASLSAMLSAEGYHMSAEISKRMGPFPGFDRNRSPMLRVMGKHAAAAEKVATKDARLTGFATAAAERWRDTVKAGELWGYRNAQISVIAPTGTIGLLMGCDTLGLEPELSLVKVKNLVGGGQLRMVNRTAEEALEALGYSEAQRTAIRAHLEKTGAMEGAPGLKPEHLAVFDCALAMVPNGRTIAPMGHLRMLGAVQPFLSGGASKTINLPNDATVEDIEKIYTEAWKLGVKSVALYRDGCKASQPYETGAGKAAPAGPRGAVREKLPDERKAITHHFQVGGHDGYVTVGLYPDGRPGELFFRVTKEGSTVNGLMDSLGISMSMALQHGVPLKDLVRKLAHMRFEPAGATNNPKVRFAKSIPDYVARWLAIEFLTEEDRRSIGLEGPAEGNGGSHPAPKSAPAPTTVKFETKPLDAFGDTGGTRSGEITEDSPSCAICGGIMVRSGTCYACTVCGSTSGCS